MNRKLGINVDCIKNDKLWQNLYVIKDAGFESFFAQDYDDETLTNLSKVADELGLDFEFIHGPWRGINSLWTADEDPELYFEILECIRQAHKYGVGGIILHVSSGYTPPEICDKGLKRYDAIINLAKELGVKVAFENLRKVGNVIYLMDRYSNEDNVVFCYDFGHAFCYTDKRTPWLDLIGNKTVYTHIHDNFGKTGEENEDLHLLPFEGLIDYQSIIDKLDEYDYKGSLMLEVFDINNEKKGKDFIFEAYKRLKKINDMSK